MAIETLRPTSVGEIKIVRGSDNTYVFTVLGADGLPKDMSQYVGLPPRCRFLNATLSNGGTTTATDIAQAMDSTFVVGTTEWLSGGVGGQIHVKIQRDDYVDGFRGSTNASQTILTGPFDIQVRQQNIDLTSIGGPATGLHSIQRAITGTWRIDSEVTGI